MLNEIKKVEQQPPEGIALRAQVLAELWAKDSNLRRDVWLYALWLLLLDITPVWAKLLAPVGSLERSMEKRDFQERTDLDVDRKMYPDLAREVVAADYGQFLEQKLVESVLAKGMHALNGSLETVNNLITTRHEAHARIAEAYGPEGLDSPEAQEALGVVEAACSSVADAYGEFLRGKSTTSRV